MSVPDDTATELLPSSSPAEKPGTPGELLGRTLGKFQIVERLGRGGSGDVYRAEQVQLGRSAVVKVLRRDLGLASNRVDRFLREARLASRLDHPYAAHVYAFGAEPDGILWIAMEHVRGGTLDDVVTRRGAMPAAVFGPLFARLCEVVHSAHELGIVHRDIKGTNVMVLERAGQLLPKLLDFGIAKSDHVPEVTAASDEKEAAITSHGSMLGSPQYMAPEQWRSAADVDARADIYALGVLAYRCLSGQLPFGAVNRAQLAHAHAMLPPPALPASVPAAISEVIARALAKEPGARWPTALAFGEAMRSAIGGVAPEAVPILDPATRDAWFRGGPQPLADAIARLARASTTVEADAALRELVAITCRWLAVLALAQLEAGTDYPAVAEHARGVIGRDDGAPWIRLARSAVMAVASPLPGLAAAIAGSSRLEELADRLDDRSGPVTQPTPTPEPVEPGVRYARTAAGLAAGIAALADALRPLEPLLAYQLVVGKAIGAESWQGPRRRDRERVVVWGEPLADGQVALLDGGNRVVAKLSPLVQVLSPLPSAEPELFLLWRTGRGAARLVAAPWGFERDDEAAAQRLAILSTDTADTLFDHDGEKSPYLGLAAYGAGDAQRFVGREREVEALANRLVRSPLSAVLGPSGAGKSSFIHAGLVPRLAEHHEIVALRPGRHPMRSLAALPAINTRDEIVERLRELGERAPRGLVVIVDQLEELVTLCADAAERTAFADVLARAADGPAAPVRVVVTLRDDFATVLESEAAFRGRFDVFVLATPPPEALRRIVTEPARRSGVAVEPSVVEAMVAEVAGRPASLPLLSFTASQLWQSRDRAARTITHAAYEAIGGVAGALATYADEVYGSLARRDQDVLRDLFARLVAGDGTRIPVPRAELEQLPGAPAVLEHLIHARLLVVRDEDMVELVHECLAERWPRLAQWRIEDAADRAVLADVRTAARRWRDAGRPADRLWRGRALAELARLAARAGVLTDDERAFLAAAQRAQQRARRVRRLALWSAMTVLGAIALVMAYLGTVANRHRAEAEASEATAHSAAQLAEARLTASLLEQARRELNDVRPLHALAYLAEALRRGADTPAVRAMISYASRAWPYELDVRRNASISSIESAPDWIVAGDLQGVLHWWTAAGVPTGDQPTGLGRVDLIERQADGRLIVTGRDGIALVDPKTRTVTQRLVPDHEPMAAHLGPAADELTTIERGDIRVYDLATGKLRRELRDVAASAEGAAAFETSGAHATLLVADGIVTVDLARMTTRTIAPKIDGTLGWSDDGSRVGYVDGDGLAHILAGDGTELHRFRPANRPHSLVFSHTGDRIGAVADGSVVVHDPTGKPIDQVPMKSPMALLELVGDDTWVAGPDGAMVHYHKGIAIGSFPGQLGEVADFHVTDKVAMSIGVDGTLVMLRNGAQLRSLALPCEQEMLATSAHGIATAYHCQGDAYLYVGTHFVAKVPDHAVGFVAYHDKTQRAALANADQIDVLDGAGVTLATSTDERARRATVAFEDADHLLVVRPNTSTGVWRWTFAKNRWEQLATIAKANVAAIAAGGMFVGTDDAIALVHDGKEIARAALPAEAQFLVPSRDGRWLAVALGNGVTALVDGTTGALVRQLEQTDAQGPAPAFDATGDLLLRAGRGALAIWDRASGDILVWNIDLLRDGAGGRFLDDGRIELDGWGVGILEIPRDARPAAAILHDIACKVPLRVVDGRLGPATPSCQ